jgi:predicted transcriptional regulator YdeE
MKPDDWTDGFLVAGVSARVRNDDPASIGRLWEQFRVQNVAAQISTKLSGDIHCVYHAYEGDHRDPFHMTIGFKVPAGSAIPSGLGTAHVPAQRLTIYDASGQQPAALITTWMKIWDSRIARSFLADFDLYDCGNPERVTVHVGIQ